ncbi:MAG: 50S ribosomal protein L29 [Flavobacteriales bacterium]|nr:50S ribosomal protein L29 [Flavobacteriales bacterium]
MTNEEIKQMSDLDLQEALQEKKAALADMKFNHTLAGLENPMQLRAHRKEIARLSTELSTRKNKA